MNTLPIHTICQWNQKSADLLYEYLYPLLVSYAASLIGDAVEAEDMAQEAIAAMWQRRPQFKSEAQLRAYLYNSVANRANSASRHDAVHQRYIAARRNDQAALTTQPEVYQLFEEDVYVRLFQLIDAMPERQRQVFLLIMEGKRNTEIAKQLNISAETVKTQKKRGLARLRQQMSDSELALLLTII